MPFLRRDLPEGPLDLFYECSGALQGPALVLLPGWTLNYHLWDGQAEALGRRFRVVRLDPRNTGRSTSDPRLDSSRIADAEDLAALLDHLGAPKAHTVGHSKGARTLGTFVCLFPGRTLSAAFVGTAEPHQLTGKPGDYREVAHAGVDNIRRLARTKGVEAALAKLQRGNLFGKLRTTPEGMRILRVAMEGYRCADLLSEIPVRHADLSALPELLQVPVLVLCGEDDPFLGECRHAAGLYRDARLTVLPHCGHLPMLESPQPFLAALETFYAEALPPTAAS